MHCFFWSPRKQRLNTAVLRHFRVILVEEHKWTTCREEEANLATISVTPQTLSQYDLTSLLQIPRNPLKLKLSPQTSLKSYDQRTKRSQTFYTIERQQRPCGSLVEISAAQQSVSPQSRTFRRPKSANMHRLRRQRPSPNHKREKSAPPRKRRPISARRGSSRWRTIDIVTSREFVASSTNSMVSTASRRPRDRSSHNPSLTHHRLRRQNFISREGQILFLRFPCALAKRIHFAPFVTRSLNVLFILILTPSFLHSNPALLAVFGPPLCPYVLGVVSSHKGKITSRPDGVVGYHVSLTRIRSWDRTPVWSFITFCFCESVPSPTIIDLTRSCLAGVQFCFDVGIDFCPPSK